MLPIILTKKQRVLIVGAGRAAQIKIASLLHHECEISVVAKEFLIDLDANSIKIVKDFYTLEYAFFQPFDLIYIAIPLEESTMVERLLESKMVNVLSHPEKSNFIHPCVREDGDIMLSVHNLQKPNPKKACHWANKFIEYKN